MYANQDQEDSKTEKHLELALRTVGHEILLSIGDCDSRVLPVKKVNNKYQISFEREFGVEPDVIVNTFEEVMSEFQIAKTYLVEVEQCETGDVVHIFELGPLSANQIPCQERALSSDCYNIFITIWDDTHVASTQIDAPIPSHSVEHLKTLIFFGITFLLLAGFVNNWLKNKTSKIDHPEVISIGASTFDKKYQSISFENKKVDLSHKETALLSLLHGSANQAIEREVILKRVWGDDGDYIGRTVDVFISKLRRKLEPDSSVKIVNIRGVGYKLVLES